MIDMEQQQPVRIRMPREGEIFGMVEQMLGSDRMSVKCKDGYTRMCRVPGRMRKRVWIREGDIVLVKPWQVQSDQKADIAWRYTVTEASSLRRKGLWKD